MPAHDACKNALDGMERTVVWLSAATLGLLVVHAFGDRTASLGSTSIPADLTMLALPLIYLGAALHMRRLANTINIALDTATDEDSQIAKQSCRVHSGLFNPYACTTEADWIDASAGIVLLTTAGAAALMVLLLYFVEPVIARGSWVSYVAGVAMIIGQVVVLAVAGAIAEGVRKTAPSHRVVVLKWRAAITAAFITVPSAIIATLILMLQQRNVL